MSTMTENVIVAGADNRPPMLDKSQYNLWQSYMLLYVQGKENGKQLYDSVINRHFQYGTVEVPATLTSLQTTRPRTYKDLIKAEKILAKEIWDRVKLLIKGPELSLQERDSKLYNEFDTFTSRRNNSLIDDIDAFDSDCDEAPSASIVLMAKLFAYDFDVLSERKYFELKHKELFIENDRLLEHIICQDVMCIAMHADLENKCVLHANDDNINYAEMEKSYIDEYSRCLELEVELSKKKDMVENAVYNELSNKCSRLEKRCISLELKVQQIKESFDNDRRCKNQDALEFPKFFEINDLKAQLKKKNTTISYLKDHIATLKGKSMYDCTVQVNNSNVIALGMYKLDWQPLPPNLRKNKEVHVGYLKQTNEHVVTLYDIVEQARALQPLDSTLDSACKTRIQELAKSVKINKMKEWKPTGPLRGGFCWFCAFRAETSFDNDPNPNFFDDSQNLSDYPPQPQYETYLCELCGNDSHYGYDCPPRFPLQFVNHQPQEILEVIPFIKSKEWIETKNELYKMMEAYTERMNQQRDQEALLAAQKEQELRKQEQAAQREQELLAQKQAAQEKEEPPQNSNFRQLIGEICGIKARMAMNTVLLSINLKSQRLDKEKQKVKNIVEQATKRDEHLSIIPETESDKVIKSNVKNLVPIPCESEVTFDNESECDMPVNDESSLIFTTFSNPLFDCNDVFTSSDDKSLSNEDVPMENFKIYSNPLFDDEEIISTKIEEADFDLEEEICLVENLLYDNSSPRPSKELNAKIADTEIDLFLATDDLMPPGIENDNYDSEGDIYFLEELLSSDPLPLPENESSNFDHHDDPSFPRPPSKPPDVEVFFDFKPDTGVLTTKVVKGISEHYVLMPNIFPTLPTLDHDLDFTPSHDSIGSENKDKVFKPGMLAVDPRVEKMDWEIRANQGH
uniref:CCHC-type domain-containing protein n=1 Tax=Tanacetum cinerariifolium TaxID=118510 RepID=A0A6L2LKW0_TANCI|nr:hypothetical protein [Tanacetum cinerariifolium]